MKRVVKLPELTLKAKLLVGLAVIIFVGAIAVFIVTLSINNQLSDSDTENFKNLDAATRQKDATKTAQTAIDSGDSKKAGDIYEQAIAAEPDPTKKVELAVDYSATLNSAGKFEDALAVAKKAESYSSDKYLITRWLALLNELGGRYAESATYYEKTSELVSSPNNKGRYTKDFYIREAARVRALEKK